MKDVRLMTDDELHAADAELDRKWNEIRSGVGGSGSPGEWIWERSEEIATELKRRVLQSARDAVWEDAAKICEGYADDQDKVVRANAVARALRERKGS